MNLEELKTIWKQEEQNAHINGWDFSHLDGIVITEQVGSENERDLIEMVLPGLKKPFPHLNLKEQRKVFEEAGFHIIREEEAYRQNLY